MNEYNNEGHSSFMQTQSETKTVADDLNKNILPVLTEGDEIIDMGEDFDFDGFQVVRREFFAHMREPSCSFNNCKFYVNAACLAKFPTSDFAQVLINRKKKILALRPCLEGARDSFQWCTHSKGKRKAKQITCRLFFAKIVSMMGWDPNHRYKILGQLIHSNDEYLLAFDLTASETYKRTFVEGEKPKTSRIPIYPIDWQDQFGLPYNEHKQLMKINIVDGYAVYSIKDTVEKPDDSKESPSNTSEPTTLALGPGDMGGAHI